MAELPVLSKMIKIFVGAVLAAALIPVALLTLANAAFTTNVTGTPVSVDPSIVSLFGVVSIAIVIAVVILFFKMV